MMLFCGALLGFPILVQATAPPLRVCAGVFFIEEEDVIETPVVDETPILEEHQF